MKITEREMYITWFRREVRRIRLDMAEWKRPGAKTRITRTRRLYRARRR